MSAPIAAIIVSKKRRQIIDAFRKSGTVSSESAKTLEEIDLNDSVLLKVQRMRNVIVEAKPNHFYLDEVKEKEAARSRIIFVISVIIIILFVIMYVSN